MKNDLPKLDLTTFFLSVSAAAMQSVQSDLEMARQNIELLELMQIKTQGNRTDDEEQLLTHLLFQLRMAYVEAQKNK
jgi:hypothetical protein